MEYKNNSQENILSLLDLAQALLAVLSMEHLLNGSEALLIFKN